MSVPINEVVETVPDIDPETKKIDIKKEIYLAGHTSQVEYKQGDVHLISSLYGPHSSHVCK